MKDGAPERGDGTVGKALDVLDLVAGFGRPVRFSDLLAVSPLPKATLYRMIQTLANQRMLAHDAETGTYAPGLRLVQLAHAAWRQSSLAPLARPLIDALSADVGETIHLAQLDKGQVLYVDKRNARTPIQMFSDAGKIGPGYCTGVGKAMLAFLPEDELDAALKQQAFHAYTPTTLASPETLRADLARIRDEGIAFDREEHEPGIICIAAPILTNQNRPLGALSITASTQRMSLAALADLKPALTGTAKRISGAVADWRFPDTAG